MALMVIQLMIMAALLSSIPLRVKPVTAHCIFLALVALLIIRTKKEEGAFIKLLVSHLIMLIYLVQFMLQLRLVQLKDWSYSPVTMETSMLRAHNT